MKIVIVGIGYVLCIWGGGLIIGKICKILKLPHNQNIGLLKAGTFIGYFERFLILTFILINIYEPIGLLFVGKSIIRFSNREESEYFLIGTLASFSWAVFLGIILTFLIK
ncbi:MAG: hypothetical protein NC905_07155 [Candidatus Omnitrophica bacterium]|nr:hypothetical protein [Candidatus Omnitrophota bacterium]